MNILVFILIIFGFTSTACADGYDETIAQIKYIITEKKSVEAYVSQRCAFVKGGPLYNKQEVEWQEAFSRSTNSNFSCFIGNGTFMAEGNKRLDFNNWKIYKYTYNLPIGLVHEIFFYGDEPSTWRISDLSGNYITLSVNSLIPQALLFIDAKLPIVAQTALSLLGQRAVQFQGNELIQLLNDTYKLRFAEGGDSMFAIANSLLLDLRVREIFVETAVEIITAKAKR